MFIERDDILINVEHISCITKEENKIIILISCGKLITYDFSSKSDLERAYLRIKDVINDKIPSKQEVTIQKAAVDWLFKDDD